MSGLAGELRGLPGQGGYDTAALREEILQSVGVQRTVSLPQCLPQVKELLALFRLGAQQKVRRPGCEGGATGGMDPAGIVHPAGCLRGSKSVRRHRGPSGGCRLSPRCLEKLAGYLEQGPAEHGWIGDLGGGKRARAACGGYICFEDEAGFTRRPPKGRTWGWRGRTPVVTVSGRRSGRLSVAGLIAMRPGSRTRLCHRLRTHPAGKGKHRSMGERDFIALIDGVHQLVKAPIVLVWDRLNTHVSHAMRELIAERKWLTVFLLPAYSPDLNPVEGVWANAKRSQPRRCRPRPPGSTRPQASHTAERRA
ncbi:transposase [Streptomyces sp. NPDC058145]|uniref:transposase n=1 Tax=Streptomyces sp. NPDC058145 TaxID=3346356 RepID=UPI0036E643EA